MRCLGVVLSVRSTFQDEVRLGLEGCYISVRVSSRKY